MTGPGIYTADIFGLADLCIEAGWFPDFDDKRYALLFGVKGMPRIEIRRVHVNFLLPHPCRVWLAKGKKRRLLGDSHSLPADLADGCRPPFVG
ncbi:hypothetical protein ES707_19625 [subsurface metagenome]